MEGYGDRKGRGIRQGFQDAEQCAERGNEYIDLAECYDYRDEKGLVELFRKYGIERFTFSSGWSSAVESAWIFTENGCTLEGMVKVHTQHKAWGSDEYEIGHGYLFKVN